MIVHEDGSVTGSIDHAALAQVEPKTDEARAQIAQLQAEQQAGAVQADADAARLAEVHAAQSPWTQPVGDYRDAQGKSVGAPADEAKPAADQSGTQKTQDAAPAASTSTSEPAKDTGASSRRSSREG